MMSSSSSSSSHQIPLLLLLVFFLCNLPGPVSASASVSGSLTTNPQKGKNAIAGHQGLNRRMLLQAKKPCPINIENQNYTIITSQCKGPNYPPEPCCSSFKELACPFAAQINDLSNDCSDRMFSYISTVGQYPPGLFGSICREDKEGLSCPAPPPSPTPNTATSHLILGCPIFTFVVLLLLPLWFVM